MTQLKFNSVRFQSLFITQFLGAFNDNFFKNALVILITYQSVKIGPLLAQELVALAGAIFILPYFLFSATAGQLADLKQKRSLIIITKVTELLIMLAAVLGFFLANYLMLLLVLFLMGVQSTFFGPLKYGVLPDMVGEKNLVKANCWVTTSTFVAILIGTIAGGLSAATEDFLVPLSFGLIFISVLGIFSALYLPKFPVHPQETLKKVDWTMARPTWQLMALTIKDRRLFFLLMNISWFWFLGAGVLSLLPVLVKDVLGGSEAVATLFLALFTVGMGIGATVSEKIGKDRPELGLPALAALGMSLTLLLIATASQSASTELVDLVEFFQSLQSWFLSFLLLLFSVFGGCYIVPLMSAVQKEAKVQELARIIAGNNIWNALFMVLVSVLLMLGYALGATVLHLFFALGLANIVVSFYLYAKSSDIVLRVLGYLLTHLFYRLKVKGRENLPDNGPYLILCNHVSFIDWLILFAISKHPVRFVIDHSYYFAKGMPFWLKQAKLIPIATRRERAELMEQAFKNIGHALEENAVVGIFPEGMITHDGKMRRLQPGVRKILRSHPVPVVPVVIKGMYGSNFSRSGKGVFKKCPSFWRRKIEVEIAPAVPASEFDLKLMEMKMRLMLGEQGEQND